MAHRSSFRSSCEILELEEEELNPLEHYTGVHHPRTEGKDRRSHASNLGRMSSLEDDLSQLFEIFNRRSASQGPVHSPHNGVGLFKKNSSKKSIRASSSSHEYGASEGASLKQAFRGLSISQASQLASAKRSVKSGGSSKAGQMVTAPRDEVKQSLLEISFMPDESDPSGNGANKTMESYEMPKLEAFSAERKTSVQTRPDGPSSLEETLQDEMLYPLSPSSSPILDDNLLRTANSSLADTLMFSATSECASRRSSTEILQKREHADLTREPTKIYPTPYKKPMNKGSAKTSTLEDKASAGLPKESHLKKSTNSVSRLVKPVIKTKNFVKRKTKKDTSIAHSEFNNVLYPGSNHIVCPRCQCVLNEEWEEVEEESAFSPGASPSAEQSPVMRPSTELSPLSAESPDNVFSDISNPTFNLDSTNKSQETVGEFTQSSKSSPDESSSSTSISQENNQGRPSSWDRPHMSKDARWQAIRQIRMQHGNVGLKNFNLLKKLGCGDIGTVYLAELIGTNCLFAIKVMDSEFLARRKKIVRAQTEREILRMLDHPFLPTLFSQFTSDNLSCLVMEYCPGGDLHVLRQMQTGRCFTEQATRFYVAEVLLALEYLHMLGVIYRDLKPENILVREDGHIMLSDFDLSLRCAVNPTLLVSPSASDTSKTICVRQPSCQVSCFGPKILKRRNKPRKLKPEPTDLLKPLLQLVAEPTDARSNSFVGTHEYLAPEIIKGEGHGSSVDWWTLGIFLYELLYGRTPFRGSGNEETLANVVLHGLKFPDSPLVSLQARDLIAGLLVKDPENRLGFERGAAEIKQHPFFEGLNWALIRCAVPPELPEFQRIFGAEKGSLNEKLNNGVPAHGNNNRYLEFNASTGEHLEFEVF